MLAVGLFASTLTYEFVYDDHVQIQANPWLQSPDGFRQFFTQPFWGFYRDRGEQATNYYRPLYGSVYALTARALGVSPLPFHAISLLLHGAIALLVVLLVPRLRSGEADNRGEGAFPLLVAGLLFAVHPAHAETVAWVGGQADLLAALGSLLALWFLLDGRDPALSVAHRRWSGLVFGPAAFLAAALSKETGFAFLALPLALELSERKLPPEATCRWRSVVTRLSGYSLAAALYLALRLHALGALAPRRYGVTAGPAGAVTYALELFGRYLAFLAVPFPARTLAQIPRGIASSPYALGGLCALLLLVGGGAWVLWRGRGPRAWVLPLAFLVAFLLPVLAADAIGGANFAERYLYLPSIGLAWLGAAVGRTLGRAPSNSLRRRALGALGLTAAAALATATVARAGTFRDDLTLFSAAVIDAPSSYIAHNNLGLALYEVGRLDDAEREYREALRLSPWSVAAHGNLGLIAERRGDRKGADHFYRAALALSPRHALAALHLARLARRDGDTGEAARILDRFLVAGGASYETLCLRAELWLEAGEPDRALPLLRRATAEYPDRSQARRLLSRASAGGAPL